MTESSSPAVDLYRLARNGPVHFMGIGGAGMSPLAEAVLSAGGRVTGCDLSPDADCEKLERLGARIFDHHDYRHLDEASALVATSAIPDEHPELVEAQRRSIPVFDRAEALGAIANSGKLFAVAGTHGKSTTTALLTAILAGSGRAPTSFVGARIPEWQGGFYDGDDRTFVVEADEYNRSFLALEPNTGIITALERDHLEIYGSFDALVSSFAQFTRQIAGDGHIVACSDNPGIRKLVEHLGIARPITYGTTAEADWQLTDLSHGPSQTVGTIEKQGQARGKLTVNLPGKHNALNALGAVVAAYLDGVPLQTALEALEQFQGIERRYEVLGETRDIVFVDDYAHHPTELESTLETTARVFPDRRIVAIFQPHLYSRTRDFARDFGRALSAADRLWVTDIYPAREKPIPGITAELVVEKARSAGSKVAQYTSFEALPAVLADTLRPGDVCLTLGAGDIDRIASRTRQRLRDSSR